MVVCKDGSVQLVSEDRTVTLIEPNANIQQVAVFEHFGLFVARVDKGILNAAEIFLSKNVLKYNF